MFENIGRKVMGLARFMCIGGISASVLWGFASIFPGQVGIGIAIIIVGVLLSWISSWVTYAIGYIAENVANASGALTPQQAKEIISQEIERYFQRKAMPEYEKSGPDAVRAKIEQQRLSEALSQKAEQEKSVADAKFIQDDPKAATVQLLEYALKFQTDDGMQHEIIQKRLRANEIHYQPLDDFAASLLSHEPAERRSYVKQFLASLKTN